MMALLSLAWWTQKLTGVAAQAIAIVIGIAVVIGGLAWLRHDAVLTERAAAQVRMEKARTAQLLVLRRKEQASLEIGRRAEKDLLNELDLANKENEKLKAKLLKKPTRPVVYPKEIVPELNR